MTTNLVTTIQNKIKSLRRLAEINREDFSVDEPVFTEIRTAVLNGKLVSKLILFLRGTGCSSIQSNGGCTFCGFYSATNLGIKLTEKNFMNQFKAGLESNKSILDSLPIVSIYNDGSMLAENEIGFPVLLEMIGLLSTLPRLKRITIESRISDIQEEKLKRLRGSTNKEIEIAFGFESSNPTIRKLCVNKNFSNRILVEKIQLMQNHGIRPVALVMIKPPFLTEVEAIQDSIESLKFLEETFIERIDFELPTVEEFTLSHELWKSGIYKPIFFWSLLEVLRSREVLHLTKPVYISPPNYTVQSLAVSSNCEVCDPEFTDLFTKYNESNQVSVFSGVGCSCKEDWKERLIPSPLEELPLVDRIEKMVHSIGTSLEMV